MLLAAKAKENPTGISVLFALVLLIATSVWLGTLAHRVMEKKKFREGYFLGNRGLGAWALALTATVQSGGTFMGFPSMVYSFGWIVLLWIATYMVVPLTGFAVVGKRLAQLSRRTNAVTVPELLRERFGDARVGLIASLMIMCFLSFTMFAQFKAGATVMQHAWPDSSPNRTQLTLSEDISTPADGKDASNRGSASDDFWQKPLHPQFMPLTPKYYVGLVIFSITVVGYTLIGGFLASVWTDLFQSVMMVIGVMLLVCLAVPMAGGLEQASRAAIAATSPEIAFGPGHSSDGRQFLTPGLAFSMFVIWVFSGFASPASMVRVMAAQNTEVMRKSIVLLSCYNCLIYIPLAMTCIAARSLLPDLGAKNSDAVIPRMCLLVTEKFPWNTGEFVSGLILAAPFGAIMASVSCFVLVIASGLVEDIYAQFINPNATEAQLRRATTISMIAVGVIAVLAVINPPVQLQALVVLSSSAGAASFVAPLLMACYWRRSNAAGALTGMLSGFVVYFGLYSCGWAQNWATANPSSWLSNTVLAILGNDPKIGAFGLFRPYYILGLDPVIWGLLTSTVCGVVVTLVTPPPPEALVRRYFDVQPPGSLPSETT